MRLKIVRSRETSPVIQNSASQTKIMGNVSIKKITLVHNRNRKIGGVAKPVTTQISLCDNNPRKKKASGRKPGKVNPDSRNKGYINGAKHVELSFEEELDVENIYKENSILNEQIFQQSKRPKGHKRRVSEFEEEGKENLSSEGDETDVKER